MFSSDRLLSPSSQRCSSRSYGSECRKDPGRENDSNDSNATRLQQLKKQRNSLPQPKRPNNYCSRWTRTRAAKFPRKNG